MIRAKIEANNAKVTQLANEQGWKVAQNVGAGVVGIVIWPVWFGMDFKDAAGKKRRHLKHARNISRYSPHRGVHHRLPPRSARRQRIRSKPAQPRTRGHHLSPRLFQHRQRHRPRTRTAAALSRSATLRHCQMKGFPQPAAV